MKTRRIDVMKNKSMFKKALSVLLAIVLVTSLNCYSYSWGEVADDNANTANKTLSTQSVEDGASSIDPDASSEKLAAKVRTANTLDNTVGAPVPESTPITETDGVDKPASEGSSISVASVGDGSEDTVLSVASISDSDVARIGDTGYATLQAAVDASKNGDVVFVRADSVINEYLSISDKSITINLQNSQILSPQTSSNDVVKVSNSSVTIKNGTIGNGVKVGNVAGGRGISSYNSDLTLDNVTITNNKGNNILGCGVYSKDGSLTLNRTTIQNNTNTKAGAGVYAEGCSSVVLSGGTIIAENSGAGLGAGLACIKCENVVIGKLGSPTIEIKDNTVTTSTSTSAASSVGGAYFENCNATIENTNFTDNSACGLSFKNTTAKKVKLDSVSISSTRYTAAALYVNDTVSQNEVSFEAVNCTFDNNKKITTGGAAVTGTSPNVPAVIQLHGAGKKTISGSSISDNEAISSVTTIINSAIGITTGGGKVTISNCEIKENKQLTSGGLRCLGSTEVEVSNTQFVKNEGTYAGAIYKQLTGGTISVDQCLLVENKASQTVANPAAGAIYLAGGTTSITGSVIKDNEATTSNSAKSGGIVTSNASGSSDVVLNVSSKDGVDTALYNNKARSNANSTFEKNDICFYKCKSANVMPAKNMKDACESISFATWQPLESTSSVAKETSSNLIYSSALESTSWIATEAPPADTINILAEDGTVKKSYTSFYNAMKEVDSNETIQLLANVDSEGAYSIGGCYPNSSLGVFSDNVTLDLNGYNIKATKLSGGNASIEKTVFRVTSGKSFTIKGSGCAGNAAGVAGGHLNIIGNVTFSKQGFNGVDYDILVGIDGSGGSINEESVTILGSEEQYKEDATPVNFVTDMWAGELSFKSGTINGIEYPAPVLNDITVNVDATAGKNRRQTDFFFEGKANKLDLTQIGDRDYHKDGQGYNKAQINGEVNNLILYRAGETVETILGGTINKNLEITENFEGFYMLGNAALNYNAIPHSKTKAGSSFDASNARVSFKPWLDALPIGDATGTTTYTFADKYKDPWTPDPADEPESMIDDLEEHAFNMYRLSMIEAEEGVDLNGKINLEGSNWEGSNSVKYLYGEDEENYNYLWSLAVVDDGQTVRLKKSALELSPNIYVDGTKGSDDNEGTFNSPVKTFKTAADIAKDTERNSIKVIDAIVVNGSSEWASDSGLTISRAKGNVGPLVNVQSGAKLTMTGINLNGSIKNIKNTPEAKSAMVFVNQGAELFVNGGSLKDNDNVYSGSSIDQPGEGYEGGAIHNRGITTISGNAVISGNIAKAGGGIFTTGTLNLANASVSNNQAAGVWKSGENEVGAYGGGILVANNGILNMSGGEVSNNKAGYSKTNYGISQVGSGGGIALGNGSSVYVLHGKPQFNMTGGTISGNTSSNVGGGLFVQQNSVANISVGTIANNKCESRGQSSGSFGGGGIYVNGGDKTVGANFENGVLNLTNVVVSENKASGNGGGVAVCGWGNVIVNLNEGGMILGNTGYSDKPYDLYVQDRIAGSTGASYTKGQTYVSRYMLGGYAYQWMSVESDISETIGRGDIADELAPVNNANPHSMKWYAGAEEHLDASDDRFAVRIMNNESASNGGGIGCNGTLNIGTNEDAPETITLNIDKTWLGDEGYENQRPNWIRVLVQRSIDGENWDDDCVMTVRKNLNFIEDENGNIVYDTVYDEDGTPIQGDPLVANPEWKASLGDFLKTDADGNEYQYRIVEEGVSGYESEITGVDGLDPTYVPENGTLGFKIRNSVVADLAIEKVLDNFDAKAGDATVIFRVKGYESKQAFDGGADAIYSNVVSVKVDAETSKASYELKNVPAIYYVVEEVSTDNDNFQLAGITTNVSPYVINADNPGIKLTKLSKKEYDESGKVLTDNTFKLIFTNTFEDENTYGTGAINVYSKDGDKYTWHQRESVVANRKNAA